MSRKEWKQLKRTQLLFEKIQERLRARHKGHVVAIELESGHYVVGANELDAARRALTAFPGKIFNSSVLDIPPCINSEEQKSVLRGFVNQQREPWVRTHLMGRDNRKRSNPAVIDTGFNGALSVPERMANELGWRWLGYESFEIATGDIVREKIYLGRIHWMGCTQDIYAVASHSKDVLIGTHLLEASKLKIDFLNRTVLIC